MRRHLFASALVLVTLFLGMLGTTPAQAAPPGPQCGTFIPCEGPVERIVRICQYAYCQFP